MNKDTRELVAIKVRPASNHLPLMLLHFLCHSCFLRHFTAATLYSIGPRAQKTTHLPPSFPPFPRMTPKPISFYSAHPPSIPSMSSAILTALLSTTPQPAPPPTNYPPLPFCTLLTAYQHWIKHAGTLQQQQHAASMVSYNTVICAPCLRCHRNPVLDQYLPS